MARGENSWTIYFHLCNKEVRNLYKLFINTSSIVTLLTNVFKIRIYIIGVIFILCARFTCYFLNFQYRALVTCVLVACLGTGTPINRLPIMAKQVLDLYELYNLVVNRGGLVDVINKKLWQEIIKGLKLPSSITSAAFTLRTQWVYPTRPVVTMDI